MNIRDLEYVVAVADELSFGIAAKKCHVTQPTLSVQLKKLEETLGIPLFERNQKRVRVTDAGAKVVQIARRILHDAQAIQEVAQSSQDPLAGSIRICAIPTISSYLFPEIVKVLRKSAPRSRIILSEAKTDLLLRKLISGETDFGLVALPVEDPLLESRVLFEDPFYLAVAEHHPLAKSKNIDFATMSDYPLLLLEEGHCLGDQALSVCTAHDIEVHNDFRGTSLETLRQMVIAGTGITLVPGIAIRGDATGVRYLPFQKKRGPSRQIGIVWRKTLHQEKLLATLCDIVKHIGG